MPELCFTQSRLENQRRCGVLVFFFNQEMAKWLREKRGGDFFAMNDCGGVTQVADSDVSLVKLLKHRSEHKEPGRRRDV